MLYVDHARIPYGRMLMNHLLADTTAELQDAACKLGLSRWIQHSGEAKEHIDISEGKRIEAIKNLGANPVSGRELVYIIRKKRLHNKQSFRE